MSPEYETVLRCDLCGNSETKIIDEKGHIVQCKNCGLKFQVGSMGTTIEGEWDQVMEVLNQCRNILIRSHNRVYMAIKIDERKTPTHSIAHKIEAVME